ncbi:MAG: hypothetical protein R3B45_05075 [Bdellovibrionota bacterium]
MMTCFSRTWLIIYFSIFFFYGCATVNNERYDKFYIIGSDFNDKNEDGLGASVWLDGKPVEVRSSWYLPKSDNGLGTYYAYHNSDPFRMAYGVSKINIRRSVFVDGLIEIRKPGYNIQKIKLDKHIKSSYWFNVLNGGIGFFVDFFTGRMWEFEPAEVSLNLIKAKDPLAINKKKASDDMKEEK